MEIRKARAADAAEIANVHVFAERGFKKGYLWVLKDNPTIRFYEKTGARQADAVKKATIGGQDVEELCYVWDNIRLELS